MTQAQQALQEFLKTDMIPNLGQRSQTVEVGDILIFPDGSTALHDLDGDLIVGELVED